VIARAPLHFFFLVLPRNVFFKSDRLYRNRHHFDRSGHLAPHMSLKFRACFRGQSAVIGPVEQLGVDAVAHEAEGRGKKTQPRVQVTDL
jgi:hypothetical protein